MRVFYMYITIWFVFGSIFCVIANANNGEDFLFQEDILTKSKNISFQNDANIVIDFDITKKLMTKFDENMNIYKIEPSPESVIYYNINSKSGLTAIGIDWSKYYISKFKSKDYHFFNIRVLAPKKIFEHEYDQIEFNIYKIDERTLSQTHKDHLASLPQNYVDKIIDKKSFLVYINPDVYDSYKENWRIYGSEEQEYLNLTIATQFLSYAVNYLDGDIKIINDYERNNSFRYSLPDFLYFSAVTISTLGYGDILPNSTLIRVLVMIEALLGMIFIAVFISYFYEWEKSRSK